MLKKEIYLLTSTFILSLIVLYSISCNKDGEGIASPPSVDVTGTWNGIYSSSLVSPAQLTLHLQQSNATVTGTYTSQIGGYGTVSGNVVGNNIANFVLTLANPECQGSFSGTAMVTGDTINFDFTGHDCFGTHSNGHGSVIRNSPLPVSDSIYVIIKLLNIPQTLTFNQSHVNTNYVEYKWGFLFDTDGNDTTGLFGFDVEVSISHVKQNGVPYQESLINGTESHVIEWEIDSLDNYRGYTRHRDFPVRLDPSDNNTIIMALPRSWVEISRINENIKFYIQAYYMPPDGSFAHDETAVSSGTQTVSDNSGDVDYDFIDIISGGWNTHTLMKKYLPGIFEKSDFENKIQQIYWSGDKWILERKPAK